MNRIQTGTYRLITAGTLCVLATCLAAPAQEADSLMDAIIGGSPSLNARLRYESAEMNGMMDSDAFTLRTRLGYRTGPYHGIKAFVEFEDVSSLNDADKYNQAGINLNAAGRTVIADVEGVEINQAYLEAVCPMSASVLKAGRQRITLDDHRFIGNVGWRQNEQTYDAVGFSNSSIIDGVDLYYGYIARVNRIFGQENGTIPDGAAANAARFDSDSHLINISYQPCDYFGTTVFGYLLDLGDGAVGAANSSDTYGLSTGLSCEMGNGVDVQCDLHYARQSENSATTEGVEYSANYYKADLSGAASGYTLGAGYEMLGSDDGVSFKTPLATGHRFNGWADLFLDTPSAGLEDLYGYIGAVCPRGYSVKAYYHSFSSDEGSINYGTEFDIVASKKIGGNIKLIAKYANYDADTGPANPAALASDVERVSIEANLIF